MIITEVKVYPVNDGGRLRAYATLVFDDAFIVRDLKVIEGENGRLFVSMPSRRKKDGSFRDIAHPLNSDMRNEVEEKVIEEYNNTMKLQ
ncbi:MAG TPA: septation regulator SpoVG [Candidatus Babeliales bacterium]|nr:septation regulator SpoVG [Candidatus Babeliales bacterium]